MLKRRPQFLAWEALEAALDPEPSEAALTSRGSHSIADARFGSGLASGIPAPSPPLSPPHPPAASAHPHQTANDCTGGRSLAWSDVS